MSATHYQLPYSNKQRAMGSVKIQVQTWFNRR